MFRLSHLPLVPEPWRATGAGGFATFEGKVRDNVDGRPVTRLEYEAFDEMALAEGGKLVQEATDRFELVDAAVTHRLGLLEVGETAVVVQVAAPHRREAFAACEWIVDQLKVRVPIWKKEHFADGDSGWVGTEASLPDSQFADAFVRRQARLEEVGAVGVQNLRGARVLLVGVGGLGSASLPYLVGAGVGTLGLADPDHVEASNLHRQVIFRADEQGRGKAERAGAFARRLNPGVQVNVHPCHLTEFNVDALVAAYDWVVDGTDSLGTKFLLNAACRRHRKPFVTASVHRFEGHLLTVTPTGPCLACLFPEAPPDSCVGTCAETGVLGVTPGLFGLLQANEVLKGILGHGPLLSHHLLTFDLRTGETDRLARSARPGCLGCRGELPTDDLEVSSLEEAHRRLGEVTLVDLEGCPVLQALRLPYEHFVWQDWTGPVLLCCPKGIRSRILAERLRAEGHPQVYSLKGGTDRLA